ncbi:hypothetical protein [Caldifermentibacillus hisashii]|uniref:hypothetical protein n=1 Tax=Caldifermentibacillus hisashii TaxID=996558 RepID=UPI001C10A02B|nr:hypothetical protein [Caldifermentibacillus hisashii]MBU5340913.1 hypothetical protein [Caldifermentibacillus hisashii]
MATKPVLVVFFWLETHFSGDEILSRRLFLARNSFFWRRDPLSSAFFGWKLTFLATKPVLVVFFWLETHFFGDETRSRRLFEPGNTLFWRRNPFSSSFFGWKLTFLATKPVLVVFLSRETLFFGDETRSRRLFLAGNSPFWRRNPFSSSFFGWKLTFLATRPVLVVFFWLETHFSGDEILSRRLFEPGNSFFWRRNPFSSSFFGWKLIFLATKPVLIIIMAENYHFLATKIKKTQATKHSSSTCLKIPQYEKPFYKIVTFILIDFLFPSNSLLPHTDFSL